MDKLSFLYEVIEDIKHISSFDLIFSLIETRLREHFGVKGVVFCQYHNKKNNFYLSNVSQSRTNKVEYFVNKSPFLQKVVSNINHLEYSMDSFETDDEFLKEIQNIFKCKGKVHPIVLKDKLAGIFLVFAEEPLDNNFLYAILDIISIAFQRIVLAGHIIYSEEKEEMLEETYFKEILQNKLFECDSNKESLGFAVISVAYNDLHYQGHKTTANKEVFSKLYEEIITKMSNRDVILKYGNDRIVVISPGSGEAEIKNITINIKKTSENHMFIEKTNFRGRIKVSFGYSSFPNTAETLKDIYENALIMLHENIKIENWLKTIKNKKD